jgi:predicted nucleic acid-binding protein
MPRFLDTNVLLRYFTNDDPEKAQRALALLRRIERGDEKVVTSLLVVSEIVFTLERFYKVPKPQVHEMVRDLISLPDVQLSGKSLCLAALEQHAEKNVSFVDAYNAVYMQSRDLSEIYTWDTDFYRFAGLTLVEPGTEELEPR